MICHSTKRTSLACLIGVVGALGVGVAVLSGCEPADPPPPQPPAQPPAQQPGDLPQRDQTDVPPLPSGPETDRPPQQQLPDYPRDSP